MIKNKRIIITGIAGSIGQELCRQLYTTNKIYGIDINETGLADLIREYKFPGRVGDIRDEATIKEVFSDFKPQVIFHTAALKHVDICEYVPLEAIKTNILGTYYLLETAKKWECVEKFVFISTDKSINSTSIMGATKRLGEIMTKNSGKGFMAVRFANVLGSRGSVIPIWERQINQKKPITVTDERMERYFMTIEEAVKLVIRAAEIGQGGEIFILDMGEPIKIVDLAKRIIQESRSEVQLEYIGIRPGEKLREKLMLEEEERVAQKIENFWIIKNHESKIY